jgi:hypothetical protein
MLIQLLDYRNTRLTTVVHDNPVATWESSVFKNGPVMAAVSHMICL